MMESRPRILPAVGCAENIEAFKIGPQGLLATASQHYISIFDPMTFSNVQSLYGHRNAVTHCAWSTPAPCDDSRSPCQLRLASADRIGRIIIWDVVNAQILSEFAEPGFAVLDLQWLSNNYSFTDVLAVLHANNKFILWNTQTSIPLWSKQLNDAFTSFSFDPFNIEQLFFVNSTFLLFFDKFSIKSEPKTAGRKLFIKEHQDQVEETRVRTTLSNAVKNTAKVLIGPKFFSSPRQNSSANSSATPTANSNDTMGSDGLGRDHAEASSVLQVFFHNYRRHTAVLLYTKKILLVDLHLLETVDTIAMDRLIANFQRIHSCANCDAFVCLHETGAITVRAYRESKYQTVFLSDTPRRSRNTFYYNMVVEPLRETMFFVSLSDGNCQAFKLVTSRPNDEQQPRLPLPTIDEMLKQSKDRLQIRMTGMHMNSQSKATVIRVCHIPWLLQISEKIGHESLVAIGNSSGSVQIWDLVKMQLWREFHLFPVPVTGIDWCPIFDDNHKIVHLALVAHGCEIINTEDELPFLTRGSKRDTNSSPEHKRFYRNFLTYLNLATGQVIQMRDSCSQFGRFNPEKSRFHQTSTGISSLSEEPESLTANVAGDSFNSPSESAVTKLSTKMKFQLALAEEFEDYYNPLAMDLANFINKVRLKNGIIETPIESIKVSSQGKYLCVVFRNQPVELWDMTRVRFLNYLVMPDSPQVASVAWSITTLQQFNKKSPHAIEKTASLEDGSSASNNNVLPRETFILVTKQGHFKLVTVQGDRIDASQVSNTIVQGIPLGTVELICQVAWSSDLIAMGTRDGYVILRNLKEKTTQLQFINSGKLPTTVPPGSSGTATSPTVDQAMWDGGMESGGETAIKRLRFLPGHGVSTKLVALTGEACFVWLPKEMILLSSVRFSNFMHRFVIDVDWISHAGLHPNDQAPICAFLVADGSVRVADIGKPEVFRDLDELQAARLAANSINRHKPITELVLASAINEDVVMQTCDPFAIASLLPAKAQLLVKHLLQNQSWQQNGYQLKSPELDQAFARFQRTSDCFLALLRKRHAGLCQALTEGNLIERGYLTAQLTGNPFEIKFWRLLGHRLLFLQDKSSAHCWRLDVSWDIMAEFDMYREEIQRRANQLERKRQNAAQTENCIDLFIQLGHFDKAVSLLLETGPESGQELFTKAMHKACLVAAALNQPGSGDLFQSTLKLTSQQFLANNQFQEGIQMLCLMGHQVDACESFIQRENWSQALWLAKSALNATECEQILRRWAVHLVSSNSGQKALAALIFVYLGDHLQAMQILYSLHHYQLVTRYVESIEQLAPSLFQHDDRELTQFKSIKSDAFLEFARVLLKLGHKTAALHYTKLAGAKAQELTDEIEFMLS